VRLYSSCADRLLVRPRGGGVRRWLDTNSLSGTIPSELADLTQLQQLYVSLFALRAPTRASVRPYSSCADRLLVRGVAAVYADIFFATR
jgi:hypothetical protein